MVTLRASCTVRAANVPCWESAIATLTGSAIWVAWAPAVFVARAAAGAEAAVALQPLSIPARANRRDSVRKLIACTVLQGELASMGRESLLGIQQPSPLLAMKPIIRELVDLIMLLDTLYALVAPRGRFEDGAQPGASQTAGRSAPRHGQGLSGLSRRRKRLRST